MEDSKEKRLTEEEMKKEIEVMQQYINKHTLNLEFYKFNEENKELEKASKNNKNNNLNKVYYGYLGYTTKYDKPDTKPLQLKQKQILKDIKNITENDEIKIIKIKIVGEIELYDSEQSPTYCCTFCNKDVLDGIIGKFGEKCIFIIENLTCYGFNSEVIFHDTMLLLEKHKYDKSLFFGTCLRNVREQCTINKYLYIGCNTIEEMKKYDNDDCKVSFCNDFYINANFIQLQNFDKIPHEEGDRISGNGEDIIAHQHKYYKQICDAVDKKIYTDIIKPQCKQEEIKRLYNTLDELTDKLFTKTIVEEKEVTEGGCCGKITTKKIEKKKYDNEGALTWQNNFFKKNMQKLIDSKTTVQDICNLRNQVESLNSIDEKDIPTL